MQSDIPNRTADEQLGSPDIEPEVIRHLARAAEDIRVASRFTRWGYVSDHCATALAEIKKAIVAACGTIQ